MPTFLFDSIVFGPVHSRRLGVSLGINLLPVSRKVCSFNCIYCECGWTSGTGSWTSGTGSWTSGTGGLNSGTGGLNSVASGGSSALPSRSAVYDALRIKLSEMKKQGKAPDVITYAGNGEPTLHPDFAAIIDDSVALRNEYFPQARVSVLSNGSTLRRKSVREALKKVDMNILKLDSAIPSTVKRLNQPRSAIGLARFEKYVKDFEGRFIIQTLFVRGECNGEPVDNTTAEELGAWREAISRMRPQSVMIYTIDRDTPLGNSLKKVPVAELNEIAAGVMALGISTSVSG